MEYSRKYIFLIVLSVVVLSHFGCSNFTENIRMNQREAFDATVAARDAILTDLEQYVGKHKDELRMILGDPGEVVSPSLWNNIEYDEEWVYLKGITFINKQYRMFYIKKDIVVHVELGGAY